MNIKVVFMVMERCREMVLGGCEVAQSAKERELF
jgi:hypothetical protein